jgi:hypothetical protein
VSQWRADLLGPSALVARSVAWPAGILSPLSLAGGILPASRVPCSEVCSPEWRDAVQLRIRASAALEMVEAKGGRSVE